MRSLARRRHRRIVVMLDKRGAGLVVAPTLKDALFVLSGVQLVGGDRPAADGADHLGVVGFRVADNLQKLPARKVASIRVPSLAHEPINRFHLFIAQQNYEPLFSLKMFRNWRAAQCLFSRWFRHLLNPLPFPAAIKMPRHIDSKYSVCHN